MTDDKVNNVMEPPPPPEACGSWVTEAHHLDTIQNYEKQIDFLQAERDKLSAEVERLKTALTAEGHAYEGSLAREDEWAAELDKRVGSLHEAQQARLASEAKLTALVEALERIEQGNDALFMRAIARSAIRQAIANHSAPVGEAVLTGWPKTTKPKQDVREFVASLDAPPTTPTSASVEDVGAVDKDELTDFVSDWISDSLDMDWQARDGARAVVAALIKENLVRIKL